MEAAKLFLFGKVAVLTWRSAADSPRSGRNMLAASMLVIHSDTVLSCLPFHVELVRYVQTMLSATLGG
jgi:hypothetical protein